MAIGRSKAALGFRSHSGWAALVAVAGPPDAPAILLRRRVVLMTRAPRQPFHAAEDLPFAKAEALIRDATREGKALARRAVEAAIVEIRTAGHATVAGGLLLASGRALPDLERILASHALIHAAEGEIYREVLRDAIRACGLRANEVRETDLEDLAAGALPVSAAELKGRLAAWGKTLGPPWTQDEKRAALVAWIALAAG